VVQSADVLTKENKKKFWEIGVFSTETPKGLLQNAVFSMLAKCVVLEENRDA